MGESGAIRYSLNAVGVRKGLLNLNKRHCVPLAIFPRDELGVEIKSKSSKWLGWKPFSKEEMMRKGFWGDYSKVTVQVRPPYQYLFFRCPFHPCDHAYMHPGYLA